ncbi:GNAT family N-acetyltransferase [Neoroseomonas oryzicola]|uniref:GNAT family N-acetyltransferase n=1 Tax=Neoroseomonas oryzicola TaxID=535904 RepID=A0A9X9WHB6_9PROT|nr:GNAT family N-acetyltransferase [Neoroseomonas oryzicola]NKE17156.1 GNAT family N-acetyltransferase [Neoroseomonas oryzicola]
MSGAFTLRPVAEADFEPLLDLSIRVLREDLERVGRFDPERRRSRMRAGFDPAVLSAIEVDGRLAGCIAAAPAEDHVEVHSFYLEPWAQGRGLGAAVFAAVRAAHPDLPVRIEVLKGASVHRFWEKQGFVRTGEQPFDWLYERPAGLGAVPSPA